MSVIVAPGTHACIPEGVRAIGSTGVHARRWRRRGRVQRPTPPGHTTDVVFGEYRSGRRDAPRATACVIGEEPHQGERPQRVMVAGKGGPWLAPVALGS